MTFISFEFLVVFLCVFCVYWICKNEYRKYVIIGANVIFYMGCGIPYFILLSGVILISYVGGILLEKKCENKKITLVILLSVFISCLLFFKYAGLLGSITENLILPLGISFYTFKVISYLVDVYKGMNAEKNVVNYALYVSLFLDMASGPIDRYSLIMPQINKEHFFDYKKCTYGLKLIAWGMFKKMVVSDTMSFYTEWIYGSIYSYSGLTLLLTSIFYTVQIYCDFSAYTDIAIGLGKMLDLDLMINFKSPYFATSVKEFWNRWHISLSTWFRDYVYIPLGGNRLGNVRRAINLILTFLISGIWHGASWNFILWGGIHGITQVLEHIMEHNVHNPKGVVKLIKNIGVFVFCNFTWVLFRLTSWKDIVYFFCNFFRGISNPIMYAVQAQQDFHMDKFLLGKICFMIALVFVFDYFNQKKDVIEWIGSRKLITRWTIYSVFALLCYAFLPVAQGQEFLYFQF